MHPLVIQRGASRRLDLSHHTSAMIVADPVAYGHYGEAFDLPRVLVPPGEEGKEIGVLARVWRELFREGLDRGSVIVALGGGSVCDLAGFAAATYMRGIDLILLPSTLLAMVDASIGGKTGINFSGRKNAVGVTRQPTQVVVDLDLLESLPLPHFWSGMAEVIKAAVIGDPGLFELLEERIDELPHNGDLLEEVVRRAIDVKLAIVTEDPDDRLGRRALLNFGHTFAHALELEHGLLHGHAVAIGMCLAAEQSKAMDLCTSSFVKRLYNLVKRAHLPVDPPAAIPFARLLEDKKAHAGELQLVLPRALGEVELKKLLETQVLNM